VSGIRSTRRRLPSLKALDIADYRVLPGPLLPARIPCSQDRTGNSTTPTTKLASTSASFPRHGYEWASRAIYEQVGACRGGRATHAGCRVGLSVNERSGGRNTGYEMAFRWKTLGTQLGGGRGDAMFEALSLIGTVGGLESFTAVGLAFCGRGVLLGVWVRGLRHLRDGGWRCSGRLGPGP
jgi:hypothetical protein